MKAEVNKILKFLSIPNTIIHIPTYQRNYVWTKKECLTLFEDIKCHVELNKREYIKCNYCLGNLIVSSNQLLVNNIIDIVDGQQRITTLTLMLCAIKYILITKHKNEDTNELIKKINECLFKNEEIKIQGIENQSILNNILNLNQVEKNSHFYKNYQYFIKEFNNFTLSEINDWFDLGLETIEVVSITLLDHIDNPYEIFESFNSKGKELSPSELIKNLLYIHSKDENWFNLNINSPIINELQNINETDNFFRYWLALKTSKLIAIKNLYLEFKLFLKKQTDDFNNNLFESFIEELKHDVRVYKWLRTEFNKVLVGNSYINKYRILFQSNFGNYITIIWAIANKSIEIKDNQIKIIDINTTRDCINKICKLIVGRSLVNKGRVESNRTYASLGSEMNNSNKSLKEAFNECIWIPLTTNKEKSYSLPNDNQIFNVFNDYNVYDNHRNDIKDILVTIEEYISKNSVTDNEFEKLSIEHIMPQNINPSYLNNENDIDEYKKWINTIGNLTLLTKSDNSRASNKDFNTKKNICIENSRLKLSSQYSQNQKWSIDEIHQWAEKLLAYIKEIWWTNDNVEIVKKYVVQNDNHIKTYEKHENEYDYSNIDTTQWVDINNFDYLTKTKPIAISFNNIKIKVKHYSNVLFELINYLNNNEQNFNNKIENSYLNDTTIFINKNNYSDKLMENYIYKKYTSPSIKKINHNVFINTRSSNNDKLRNIKTLIEMFDIKNFKIKVYKI